MSTNLVSQLSNQAKGDELSDRTVLKSMAYGHFVPGIKALKSRNLQGTES